MAGHDQDELRRQVTRLKNCDAPKFRTLCHMHLSFLLDLDGSSFEDFLNEDQPDGKKKTHNFRHFGRKKSKGDRTEMMIPQLTVQSVNNIELLIRYLSCPENLRLEGLFRKSGHLSRQRTLRDRMEMGESLESELESGIYTGHDCANLLKALLGELPEPLLTEKHFSIYLKVPDMVQPSMSPSDHDFMSQRQVSVAQLLLQLLPRENVLLLKSVVTLLHHVAVIEGNLMTSETLGTMFAPHILVPRRMSATELQQLTTQTTRAVAFLIDHAPELFEVPQPLMRDISAYWQEMEEAMDCRRHNEDEINVQSCHKYKKAADADELRTTVTFVNRKALQRPNIQTDTQVELAQLYAHISTMPESAKKRKLLKQFNRANGVGTPIPSSTTKHKRSKSLSESIKKMVGRSNHKRRGSGNSVHAPEATSAAPKPGLASDPPPTIVQHTPIIKSVVGKSSAASAAASTSTSPADSPAPFASPVARLFKDNMDHPILPSSPCVHIVDLKASADPILVNTRKRKIDSSPAFCTPQPLSSLYLRQQQRKYQLAENYENIAPTPNFNRWTRKNEKSPHAGVIMATPEGRFEKAASSCVSPITRSMNNAPRHVKDNLLTPGSRRPMSLIQTP